MRKLLLSCLVVATSLLVKTSVLADEGCPTCDREVLITGEFKHRLADSGLFIADAPPSQQTSYRDGLTGRQFSLICPNLPAGQYTVILGFAETSCTKAGERVFDVTCGNHTLATNLDIFARVGAAKVFRLTMTVEHAGDAVAGPLTITFTGKTGEAKFNTIEIRDNPDHAVMALNADMLVPSDDPELTKIPVVTAPEIWRDASQSISNRVQDLLRRLTPAEKIALMRNGAPRIERLGIPAYNQWSESLHGICRAGIATVFPQAIGLAAMWDEPFMAGITAVIAVEGRAKHNDYAAKNNGDSARFYGLTFWGPNINIFRDPRWGRGQETYGEDPFLTARLGVSYIEGLQGDDPEHLKAMACSKHFAVHSGPESERHFFDSEPPERDLYETYLPAFEVTVREGHVGAVMGAYNSLFHEPCCSSGFLLNDLLRKQWGFTGHVVSDCGAVTDIYTGHKKVATEEEAAALAVHAGCDLCCGTDYNALSRALKDGLVSTAEIDTAVGRLLDARFRLGLFDTPETNPLLKISIAESDTPAHRALALRAAQESIVLLKNDGLLPLNRNRIKRLAVIGTNASAVSVLLGNYTGEPSHPVTILDGIKQVAGKTVEVVYDPGCPLALSKGQSFSGDDMSNTLAVACSADVVIYVGGLSPQLEGEEMNVNCEGFQGGDRTSIELPSSQDTLLRALRATGRPVVFVNCSGSAMAMPWEAKHLPAILQAWYPGEEGGRAVAEVLFGDVNPSGRLPVTFYRATGDLPPFKDYSMSNRTYRYFTGKPLFAFGHGLSYTTFKYSGAKLGEDKISVAGLLKLSVTVKNTGKHAGDEVVQVYFRHLDSKAPQPLKSLCGFRRVSLPAAGVASVEIEIPAEQLRWWDAKAKKYVVEPGRYELLIGGASDQLVLGIPFHVI